MNKLDFITNPRTGKKVKLQSGTGQAVLKSYLQTAGGVSINFDEEAADIITKRTDDMAEMGRIFTSDANWSEPITDPVFFEGDKVMIDHETVYGGDGFSNAIGTIIDPSKINNGTTVYSDIFPDGSVLVTRDHTLIFKYTNAYGQAIRIINAGGEEEDNDYFLDYVESDSRLDTYRLRTLIKTKYNKTTENNYDVSFLSAINESAGPDAVKYMVEWDMHDETSDKKYVIIFASSLLPYEARLHELGLIE